MATFTYEALNSAGKPQKGTIEAGNTEEAIARIKSQGFYPTSVREQQAKKGAGSGAPDAAAINAKAKKKAGGGFSFGGVSQKALTTFTRQLSTLCLQW